MKPIFQRLSFVVLFLFLGIQNMLLAQALNGTIQGKLRDSISKKNIPFATITVFNAKDTAILTYRLSDPNGNFKVANLPIDTELRFLISHAGYQVIRQNFQFTANKASIDIGILQLQHDTLSLEEVLVLAERPPVIVRNDTIEFNASSFKTLPNAMVEDLFKKLRGFQVDRNGNITVDGKIVNRILVDGRDFFGSDPKVASRNLPANIIDKVQVVDDKEQQEQNIFLDKSRLGKVINLTLKRSVKKGLFGKTYVGAGTDDRYEAGGILNIFRDTLQVSLIGFSNNINRPGFGMEDVKNIGGFGRSGYSSSMMSKDGGFSLDGISFGATSDGIQKSTGAGLNINTEFGAKTSVNWRYFYGQINSDYEELKNAQQFLEDTIIGSTSNVLRNTKQSEHRFGGTIRYKINPSSNITIKPSITFGDRNSQLSSFSETRSNFKGALNKSSNQQDDESDLSSISNDVNYRKSFKKRGRQLSISQTFSVSKNDNNQTNIASNNFYGGPGNFSLDQLRRRESPSLRLSLTGNYIEPLTKSISLLLLNATSISRLKDNIMLFERNNGTGELNILNPDLSNEIARNSFRNISSAGINWRIKQVTISPKASILALSIKNNLQKENTAKQHYTYFFPTFDVSWKGFYFSYTSDVYEPRIFDLQPAIDNTNPLFLQLGNPDLKPTIYHSIYTTYDKYNSQKLITYRFLFNSTFDKQAIVNQRSIDSSGIQLTKPVNASDLWNFRTNGTITKEFNKFNNWRLSVVGSLYADYRKTKFIVNEREGHLQNLNIRPTISYSLNWKDKIELSQEYSVNWGKGFYEDSAIQNTNISTQAFSTELFIRPIQRVTIESSVRYFYSPALNLGIPKGSILWNGAISFSLFKDQRASIKLTAFDLLNQNRNISQVIVDNYISSTKVTTLQKFYLLTFLYNIRNFKIQRTTNDKILPF